MIPVIPVVKRKEKDLSKFQPWSQHTLPWLKQKRRSLPFLAHPDSTDVRRSRESDTTSKRRPSLTFLVAFWHFFIRFGCHSLQVTCRKKENPELVGCFTGKAQCSGLPRHRENREFVYRYYDVFTDWICLKRWEFFLKFWKFKGVLGLWWDITTIFWRSLVSGRGYSNRLHYICNCSLKEIISSIRVVFMQNKQEKGLKRREITGNLILIWVWQPWMLCEQRDSYSKTSLSRSLLLREATPVCLPVCYHFQKGLSCKTYKGNCNRTFVIIRARSNFLLQKPLAFYANARVGKLIV